jgi:hypothetical protein
MNPMVAGTEFEDVPKRRVTVPGDMHSALFKFMGLAPLHSNGELLLLPTQRHEVLGKGLDVCKRAGWHTASGAALTYLRWTLRDQEVP